MKALKVMGTVDEQEQLTLDQSLALDKNSRVDVIVLGPEATDHDEPSQADFKQAWHEAMTGQTIPVSKLWEGLEND